MTVAAAFGYPRGMSRSPLVLVAALALLAPEPAAAYLNPDTGSMLLQALLGGAAGVAVLWRLLRGRVAAFFGRDGRTPPAE